MKILFCWLVMLGSVAGDEVSIKVEEHTLNGSLVEPNGKDGRRTKIAVVIQPGSGPTDRDGNNTYGLKTDCYKLLAKELTDGGCAVLRIDKRGVGKSADPKKPLDEKKLKIDHYVGDLTEWVKFLKGRNYVSVYIIGHSEGALIGMLAAQKEPVAGYISLCGMGRGMDEIVTEQVEKTMPKHLVETKEIIKKLKAGKATAKVSSQLAPLFRPDVQGYLMSVLQHSPAKEIAKLKTAVMIIHGSTDIQVSEKDAQLLDATAPNATYLKIAGMNHVLKTVGKSNLAQQYSYPNNVSLSG